jgi:glycine oxidase
MLWRRRSPGRGILFYNAGVKTWDVIVVGGGVIGLSLAREIRKTGRSVLVLERGEPGHEASFAAGGMLADCGTETPRELQDLASTSARMYPEFVHEVQDESGIDVDLRAQGTITFDGLQYSCLNPSSVGLTARELKVNEPDLIAPPSIATLLPERTVDPRALTAALLNACRHRGVDVSSGSEVTSIDFSGERAVGVSTTKTKYVGAAVVNCAGAWSGQLGEPAFPVRPVKGQMLAVAMPRREYLRHVIRTSDVYLIPRSNGRLLIGATLEEAGFDKRTVPDTIQRLHNAALRLMPGLVDAKILEDWAGLRPATVDGLPILGKTDLEGYYVATGHYRDGILLAPATAQVMTTLIIGGKPGCDISRFAPQRFKAAVR